MDNSRRKFVGYMGYASILGLATVNSMSFQSKSIDQTSVTPTEDVGSYYDIDNFDPEGWL